MTASRLRPLIEERIRQLADNEGWQGELYAPMRYILALGGKRIRPILLLMAYESLSGQPAEEALNAAVSVEAFHNFTLMHDDIMDKAPLRRGQPTVHEKWDADTAILSGDAMFALSMDMLVRDFPEQAYGLIREFSRVALGVCEGQMDDMVMAGDEGAGIRRYIEMIRRKTAMLIGGSLSLGALAAAADTQTAGRFYAFGEAAGIGFQLQDDYLDAFAPKEKFGKQVGGDIVENKMTWLTLRALELADKGQRGRLDGLFRESDAATKVEGVMTLYHELGIPAQAQAETEAWFDKAKAIGQELGERHDLSAITQFLQEISQREF